VSEGTTIAYESAHLVIPLDGVIALDDNQDSVCYDFGHAHPAVFSKSAFFVAIGFLLSVESNGAMGRLISAGIR